MKNVALTVLLGLVLVACPGTNNPSSDASVTDVVTSDVVAESVSKETVVDNKDFTITLPVTWKQEVSQSSSVVLLAKNPLSESMLVLTKESFTGSFDQFSIEAIRGLRGQGAEISSMQSIVINSNLFTQLSSTQGDVEVVTLLSVKNGFGYSLNCGGPEVDMAQFKSDCQKMFDSLQLK